jgi:hypothetical protein
METNARSLLQSKQDGKALLTSSIRDLKGKAVPLHAMKALGGEEV